MPGEVDYNLNVIADWMPLDTLVMIRTGNKAFHSEFMDFSIQCSAVDTPLDAPMGEARSDFRVKFTDICTQSSLTPPMIDGYDVPAFTRDIRSFTESQNDIVGCDSIYYNLLVPDNSFSANFKINELSNEICIEPDETNPLGTYTL